MTTLNTVAELALKFTALFDGDELTKVLDLRTCLDANNTLIAGAVQVIPVKVRPPFLEVRPIVLDGVTKQIPFIVNVPISSRTKALVKSILVLTHYYHLYYKIVEAFSVPITFPTATQYIVKPQVPVLLKQLQSDQEFRDLTLTIINTKGLVLKLKCHSLVLKLTTTLSPKTTFYEEHQPFIHLLAALYDQLDYNVLEWYDILALSRLAHSFGVSKEIINTEALLSLARVPTYLVAHFLEEMVKLPEMSNSLETALTIALKHLPISTNFSALPTCLLGPLLNRSFKWLYLPDTMRAELQERYNTLAN